MEQNKEFNWAELKTPNKGAPVPGEIAIVNIPVKVVFVWSDRIVDEVDENNNPTSYKEGFVMEVLGPQTVVYNGEKRMTEGYCKL